MTTDYGTKQPQLTSGFEQRSIVTFYCRAIYDYKAAIPSSISFRKNDIIEVFEQLESGWWDGLLREKRGWFPSNHVVAIPREEAESALSDFWVPRVTSGAQVGHPIERL
jgi:son of sevenless-like protein